MGSLSQNASDATEFPAEERRSSSLFLITLVICTEVQYCLLVKNIFTSVALCKIANLLKLVNILKH